MTVVPRDMTCILTAGLLGNSQLQGHTRGSQELSCVANKKGTSHPAGHTFVLYLKAAALEPVLCCTMQLDPLLELSMLVMLTVHIPPINMNEGNGK